MDWALLRGGQHALKHVEQFYGEDTVLITEIGRAMCVALDQHNAVVCIATDAHRQLLGVNLEGRGIDVRAMHMNGQIVYLDAAETLTKVVIDGIPDANRFMEVISALVDRVGARSPHVWIFSELVALMFANGNHSGAAKLEQLWSSFTVARPVFLYCAYPARAFSSHDDLAAFVQVCDDHCRLLQHRDTARALAGQRRPDEISTPPSIVRSDSSAVPGGAVPGGG